MGWRYLIVLDDIWSLKAWEELNRAFPSGDNGSRVVLTSRQESVVSNAKHICLPFFTVDESWELLQVKLFKELENIGKQISKECGGLPLIVGLVAGLLGGVEKSEQMWQKFLNTLSSQVAFRGGMQSNDVIELSYKHLSHDLKQCLLYFSAFKEDAEIEVSYLIELWVYEGFIKITEEERVEDKAKHYLNHLVGNNLVMVSERNYNGGILCLRHMTIRHYDCDSCPTEPTPAGGIETISGLEVLESLDLQTFLCIRRDEHLLRKLSNLKCLSCVVSSSYPFADEIEMLHHLEFLWIHKLRFWDVDPYSRENPHLLKDLKLSKFPSNIKEINLEGITLSSSAMSIIAQLANLEALILVGCKFEDEEWKVEEETLFCKLKYLDLMDPGITIWNISSAESFPCLEQVILDCCVKLQEVPYSLADIATLKLIWVRDCTDTCERSVKKIEEDVKELGNDGQLKIILRMTGDSNISSANITGPGPIKRRHDRDMFRQRGNNLRSVTV
nr:putative late blight resistance protein homolog R1B-16 [Ipomoea batatas]